jgi:hypothetical protein
LARELPFLQRNRRRLRVYAGRALRSGLLPAPRHRSLFLHMPKCGGTSVSEAMYATLPARARLGVIDAVSTRRAAAIISAGRDDKTLCHEDLPQGAAVFALREKLLLTHMAWDTWLIHGHVLYSQAAEDHFADRYKYVTLLRDPVARMISNYKMAHRAGVIEQDFDSYLDSPAAVSQAQVYLRYLSGQTVVPEAGVAAALALSKARLDRFAVVGFLDDLPGFVAAYRDVFGVGLRIGRFNAAPTSGGPDLNPDQMARVKALTAPDQAIYDHARAAGAQSARRP